MLQNQFEAQIATKSNMFSGESKGRWSKLRNTYLSIICLKAANIKSTDEILANKLKVLNTNDDVSVISDPFGEYHEVEYLSNGIKIKLNSTKYERDMSVVNRFTDEFKKALKETRDEQQIPAEMCDETLEEIINMLDEARDKFKRQSIEKNLTTDSDIVHEIIRPNPEDPPEEQSVLTYNYMSGIWNMIEEECRDKTMFITPLYYNFYEGEKIPEWLKNDYVTDVKIQQCKKKCLEWLHREDNTSDDSGDL